MLQAIHSAEQLAHRIRDAAGVLYNEELQIIRITKTEQMPLFAQQKEFWTAICEFKKDGMLYKAQIDVRLDNGQITRFVETKRQNISTSHPK